MEIVEGATGSGGMEILEGGSGWGGMGSGSRGSGWGVEILSWLESSIW